MRFLGRHRQAIEVSTWMWLLDCAKKTPARETTTQWKEVGEKMWVKRRKGIKVSFICRDLCPLHGVADDDVADDGKDDVHPHSEQHLEERC